eukprot:9287019-Pyramimonas_sp.AAC.1
MRSSQDDPALSSPRSLNIGGSMAYSLWWGRPGDLLGTFWSSLRAFSELASRLSSALQACASMGLGLTRELEYFLAYVGVRADRPPPSVADVSPVLAPPARRDCHVFRRASSAPHSHLHMRGAT